MVRSSYLDLLIKDGDLTSMLDLLKGQPSHEKSQTAVKVAEMIEGRNLSKEPHISLECGKWRRLRRSVTTSSVLHKKLLALNGAGIR